MLQGIDQMHCNRVRNGRNLQGGGNITPQYRVPQKPSFEITVDGKKVDLKWLDKILSIFDQKISVGEVRRILKVLGGMP